MRVEFQEGAAGVTNVVGSVVIVALAVLVLLPQPRGRPQWSFALLASGIGVGAGASNLLFPDDPALTAAMWAIVGIGHIVATAGLVGVLGSVTGRIDGRLWAEGVVAFVVFAVPMAAAFLFPPEAHQALLILDFADTPTLVFGALVTTLFFAAAWAAAFVLARWAAQPGRRDRAQAALFSSCLVVYPAWIATQFFPSGLPFGTWLALGSILPAVVVSAAWLSAAQHADRRVMWAGSWAPLVFVALGLLAGANGIFEVGGASRITMTALAAFAILRYHALGIDARLRFGISKGTVAAVVVAVVFVVSEGAQNLFGEDKQWLGLAVGGLVVFAIAPLQRAADRFAEKAVPRPGADHAAPGAEESFRDALRWALRDGRLDATEERRLVLLAERLGIKASRAFELRDEAQGKVR